MTKQQKPDEFRGATQREYAAHRGITQARVSQLLKAGSLQMVPTGGIDIVASEAILDSAAATKPSRNADYMAALTEKTRLQAAHAQLDMKERLQELVRREETWEF